MNILITGATGFIGSRLARQLAQAGHTVSGLSRDPHAAQVRVSAVTQFFALRADQRPPQEALANADAVVHLAGESVDGRWTARKKERILASRVEGTRYLVEALAEAGGGKALISASAVGYYGNRGEAELDEHAVAGTGFLSEVTQAWEHEALQAEHAGCRVAMLRLGIVLGRDGGALPRLLPLFRMGLGGPLGSGRQWWPWVHIEDVVRAMQSAAEQEWAGAFNVTAPLPVRQREFAHALGQVLHRPAIAPAPGFMLRLALGEFADELLFSRRVEPARLQAAGFQFRYPTIATALGQLVAQGGTEESDAVLSAHM